MKEANASARLAIATRGLLQLLDGKRASRRNIFLYHPSLGVAGEQEVTKKDWQTLYLSNAIAQGYIKEVIVKGQKFYEMADEKLLTRLGDNFMNGDGSIASALLWPTAQVTTQAAMELPENHEVLATAIQSEIPPHLLNILSAVAEKLRRLGVIAEDLVAGVIVVEEAQATNQKAITETLHTTNTKLSGVSKRLDYLEKSMLVMLRVTESNQALLKSSVSTLGVLPELAKSFSDAIRPVTTLRTELAEFTQRVNVLVSAEENKGADKMRELVHALSNHEADVKVIRELAMELLSEKAEEAEVADESDSGTTKRTGS